MNPLISTTGLAALIGAPGMSGTPGAVTVLDVRYRMGGASGPAVFADGHVPGAAYVDLDADLAAPAAATGAGGRHPLPDVEVFGAAMRRCGVRSDRPVVVYDDWSGRAAGRAWWLLRHHGHDDVRVLDGGWTTWRTDGGPVETGRPAVAAGDFTPGPGRLAVVDAAAVPDVDVLIDAREAERFRGDVEPVDPVAGHVPGAVSVATSGNLADDGRFRSAADLRGRYGEVGARPGADVAVYCGSGVTATHDLLALAVIGVDAALYPGSWSDWVADPDRPVARG